MDFIDLVHDLNQRLDMRNCGTSKFQLDKIICSHPLKTTILGYAPSILNDQTIVPEHLRIPLLSNLYNLQTIKWVNKKYQQMLIDLSKDKKQDYRTELVRLRIAVNMATHDNIKGLTNEEKEEWRQHIVQTFYERGLAITEYYLEKIVELPF